MKINGNEVAVKTAFVEMLEKSLAVRPCSYKPLEHLELNVDVMGAATSVSLPLSCKRLWFETYCREQDPPLSRKITTELLNEGKFLEIDTPNGPRFFLQASSEVYIEGEVVGTGLAGYCFPKDEASISNAIQTVTGRALSKALSNAGFGVVDRGELDSGSAPAPNPGPAPQNVGSTEGLPFHVGENSAPPANSTSPAPAPAPAAPVPENNAPASEQQMEMQNLFAQLGGVNDELTRAKQVPYPLRSYKYAGKKMGELPESALESLLTKESTDPKIVAAKAAAKLILEDRKKYSGKAIK